MAQEKRPSPFNTPVPIHKPAAPATPEQPANERTSISMYDDAYNRALEYVVRTHRVQLGFWGSTCARLLSHVKTLQAENQRLRDEARVHSRELTTAQIELAQLELRRNDELGITDL